MERLREKFVNLALLVSMLLALGLSALVAPQPAAAASIQRATFTKGLCWARGEYHWDPTIEVWVNGKKIFSQTYAFYEGSIEVNFSGSKMLATATPGGQEDATDKFDMDSVKLNGAHVTISITYPNGAPADVFDEDVAGCVPIPVPTFTPTPTDTSTSTPVPPTVTETATFTETPVPSTATVTATLPPPTATETSVPPTATTAPSPTPGETPQTATPVPPSPVPPTVTDTPVPATPTPTASMVPPAFATITPTPTLLKPPMWTATPTMQASPSPTLVVSVVPTASPTAGAPQPTGTVHTTEVSGPPKFDIFVCGPPNPNVAQPTYIVRGTWVEGGNPHSEWKPVGADATTGFSGVPQFSPLGLELSTVEGGTPLVSVFIQEGLGAFPQGEHGPTRLWSIDGIAKQLEAADHIRGVDSHRSIIEALWAWYNVYCPKPQENPLPAPEQNRCQTLKDGTVLCEGARG